MAKFTSGYYCIRVVQGTTTNTHSAVKNSRCVFTPFSASAKGNTCGTIGISNPVIERSNGGGSICVSGIVLVSISTPGIKLLYGAPQTSLALTESFVDLFQVDSILGANTTPGGLSVISGDYNIFVKLCFPGEPKRIAQLRTVQSLTHGATLDHTYGDIAPGYSYVDAASAAGYATLSYDQLGVGKSYHPDPIQVVQATAQVAVTHELPGLLRHTGLGGYRFDNIIGVGRSAGSTLARGITTQYQRDFDAVILSGTSTTAASAPPSVAAFNFINANTDPAPQFK